MLRRTISVKKGGAGVVVKRALRVHLRCFDFWRQRHTYHDNPTSG
jgi:hypothetical protein